MDLRVLVDGSFYLNRLLFFKRKYYPSTPDLTPEQIIQALNSVIRKHLNGGRDTY
ncbi:hypothetical protein GCM10027340_25480 [Marinomonas epiphytica]